MRFAREPLHFRTPKQEASRLNAYHPSLIKMATAFGPIVKHEFRDSPRHQRGINDFPFERFGGLLGRHRAKWTFFAMSHQALAHSWQNGGVYCLFCITESKSPDMFKLLVQWLLKNHISTDQIIAVAQDFRAKKSGSFSSVLVEEG